MSDFERKIDIKQSGEFENLFTGEKFYCDGKILVAGNGIFVGKVI